MDDLTAMVDLREDECRLAATYSGGMVRRLELAQALVIQPALLVLDEPTVGLDPVARDSVWQRAAQMQRDHGTSNRPPSGLTSADAPASPRSPLASGDSRTDHLPRRVRPA